jgi:hypothetical protein
LSSERWISLRKKNQPVSARRPTHSALQQHACIALHDKHNKDAKSGQGIEAQNQRVKCDCNCCKETTKGTTPFPCPFYCAGHLAPTHFDSSIDVIVLLDCAPRNASSSAQAELGHSLVVLWCAVAKQRVSVFFGSHRAWARQKCTMNKLRILWLQR